MEKHWHAILQESLKALNSILSELDPITYDMITKKNKLIDSKKELEKKNHDRISKWDKLEKLAFKKNANLKIIKRN